MITRILKEIIHIAAVLAIIAVGSYVLLEISTALTSFVNHLHFAYGVGCIYELSDCF